MTGGKALIFSAPSGAGKTTIVRHLLDKRSDLRFSISATTRKPRGKEENGKDYYFLSIDEFKEKIKQNELLEWQEVYPGTYYGTLRQEVERLWKAGYTVLFDVDVIGGLNLKKELGEHALAVFVSVKNTEILRDRLLKRQTETTEAMETRLQKAKDEMVYESKFDIVLVNDQLEKAFQEIDQLTTQFIGK